MFCFLSIISALILNIAMNKPIHIKEKSIIINGLSIEGSIEGADNLLILAGWCKVFHQSTENFIIGRLIEPNIINIATIFSLTSLFSKV